MRLWSIHPKYLDAQGLVALWRESLLAQAVLQGRTNGYRHHPQLRRFRDHRSPIAAIAEYLRGIHDEAARRKYRFAAGKINGSRTRVRIAVTRGQMLFEWHHLLEKLRTRSPEQYARLASVARPRPHPFFREVHGTVESWERPKPSASQAACVSEDRTRICTNGTG